MLGIEHKPRDVLFRHTWKLVRKHVLQSDQPDGCLARGFLRKRVPDDMELDQATSLLTTRRLIPGRLRWIQTTLWSQHLRGICNCLDDASKNVHLDVTRRLEFDFLFYDRIAASGGDGAFKVEL